MVCFEKHRRHRRASDRLPFAESRSSRQCSSMLNCAEVSLILLSTSIYSRDEKLSHSRGRKALAAAAAAAIAWSVSVVAPGCSHLLNCARNNPLMVENRTTKLYVSLHVRLYVDSPESTSLCVELSVEVPDFV